MVGRATLFIEIFYVGSAFTNPHSLTGMLRTYAHTFNNRNIYRDPSICSTWILSEWILRRNSSAGVICSDIGVRVSYCGTNTCDMPAEK